MNEIDKNRLERIRWELDSYISQRFSETPSETAVADEPAPEGMNSKGLQEFRLGSKHGGDVLAALRPLAMKSVEREPRDSQPLRMSQSQDIDKLLEQKKETFSCMLLRLIDEKGLKDSQVYKCANIDRRLFSKIRGDEDYMPSKKTVISFCLALQLEEEEARKLLETAGYTLSASSRFDLIIMYLIENREFNIHFANIVLADYGEGSLSR